MKMRFFFKYPTLFALLIMAFNAKAQTLCSTPAISTNDGIYSSALRNLEAQVASTYCLRIYVHVIRRSNGTGGQSAQDVNAALRFLDIDFNPHGIFFKWNGQIDYIDNDKYYNSPDASIFNVKKHTDGIDIYMYNDMITGKLAGGLANGIGVSAQFYVGGAYWRSPFGSVAKSHIISHEMGHVLFLWHTHHGTKTEDDPSVPGYDYAQCQELVNGSNSTTCGDYVADTPADPFMDWNVSNSNCKWTGSGKDANGDSYRPDEKLIMSYSHPDCMSSFSPQQVIRMKNAIASFPHLRNAVVSSNCVTGCISVSDLNIIQDVYSGNTDIQKAAVSITATNVIEINATADYSAGQYIVLNPGFQAKTGSYFNAYILPACSVNTSNSANTISTQAKNNVSLNIADENKTSTFLMYPNPAKDQITIKHNSEIADRLIVNIYNTYGNLLKSSFIDGNSVTINISDIPDGLYILKILNGTSEIETQKLLIQR